MAGVNKFQIAEPEPGTWFPVQQTYLLGQASCTNKIIVFSVYWINSFWSRSQKLSEVGSGAKKIRCLELEPESWVPAPQPWSWPLSGSFALSLVYVKSFYSLHIVPGLCHKFLFTVFIASCWKRRKGFQFLTLWGLKCGRYTFGQNSPSDRARELFKPCKDAKSLLVSIKKIGEYGLKIFCSDVKIKAG